MNNTAVINNPMFQEIHRNSQTLHSEGFQELINNSRYYDPDELCNLLSKRQDDLSIMYANSRSLPKHIADYRLLLEYIYDKGKIDIDVLCFVETWLNNNTENLVQIPGYNHIAKHKINTSRGGGISIFMKSNLTYKVRNDIIFESSEDYDCLFIEVLNENGNMHQQTQTLLGAVYRSPSGNVREFLTALEGTLSSIRHENKEFLLVGDLNIDLLKVDSDPNVAFLLDMLMNYHMIPLITLPTRVSQTSATLIDHVFKSIGQSNSLAGTLLNDITDHFMNFVLLDKKLDKPTAPQTLTYRSLNEQNIENLNQSLSNAEWSDVLQMTDVNEAYNCFMKNYQSALDMHIPLKSVRFNRFKHKASPWITRGILNSLKTKSKLYKKKEKTKTSVNIASYNKYRNTLNKVIKTAKKMYWETKFQESLNDIKETWKHINSLIKKHSNQNIPKYFTHHGKLLKNPHEIANAFNDYYINIGHSIANTISQPTTQSNTLPIVNQAQSLYLTPTTEVEVIQIIEKLKPKTSCGHDNVSAKLMKLTSLAIITPLTHLMNLSLQNGIVPDQMKCAKVLPIFKSGECDKIKNYRPISLLPSFSKVLEKIVHKRLFQFLTNNNLLFASQYGFRKYYSTELGILEFQNRIISHIQNKEHCLGLFLDLSKAFDSLQHDILLRKLQHYGIRGVTLNWFRSYLSNRTQSVSFQNVNSQPKIVNCGVPQGSVLGPLLFLIYVNDLANSSKLGEFIIYADDTNIIYAHKDKARLFNILNTELQKVSDWFSNNRLAINTEKTNFVLFKERNTDNSPDYSVKINGKTVKQTDKVKFLGVEIQSNLSWDAHCQTKANRMSQSLAILSKLKNQLPSSALELIYHSLIESHLNYGIVAWGNTTKQSLKRLQIIQKRAIRTVCKQKYNSHTDPLFRQLKILKVDDIFKVSCCKLYWKKINGQLPHFHSLQLITNNEMQVSDRVTRQSDNIVTFPVRTNLDKQTLNYNISTIWNSLPADIKNKQSHSIHSFTNKVKEYFLLSYQIDCNVPNCYVCQ